MSKVKESFEGSKFRQFLKKASKVVPDVLDVGVDILTGDISGALEKVSDKLSAKKEIPLAGELLVEFEIAKLSFQKELEQIALEHEREVTKRLESHNNLETVQLSQDDLWTKRARPTRQYFWLLAITAMIVGDWVSGKTVFLVWDNPVFYIATADLVGYTIARQKEKISGVAK